VQILLILKDPPYGSERCYNGLRLALALPKSEPEARVTVFLMADAVVAAKTGQKTPDGYYNSKGCSLARDGYCSAALAWMRVALPTPN